jgi:MFS transporter, SP family, sugar:H+ symporter
MSENWPRMKCDVCEVIDEVALHNSMNPTPLECLRLSPFLMFSTILISCGGILIGFDMAALNGILVMPSFMEAMDAEGFSAKEWATRSSWMTSSLLLGATFSSLVAAPLADMIGRKHSLNIALLIIFSGSCIQTGAVAQYMMIIGRLVVGVAIGLLSSIVPLYLAEISPQSIRGFTISMFQVMMAIGILLSFMVTLAFNHAKGNNGDHWRYILGLQSVMPIVTFLLGVTLPESPRWLMDMGYKDKAFETLKSIRTSQNVGQRLTDDGESIVITNVMIEFDKMCADTVKLDKSRQTSWYDFSSLFNRNVLLSTFSGIMINVLSQLTGFNSIIYYSSLIFQNMGITADKTTAIIGVLNVVVTFLSVFLMDWIGRRALLISGSICMCFSLLVVGSLVSSSDPVTPTTSITIGIFIALFVASYAYSFGPIAWLYPAEIFPSRVRTKGISFSTCAGWLVNFAITQSIPIMILPNSLIGGLGGTFFFFAACTFFMVPWIISHVYETSNMTLEDIEGISQINSFSSYSHYLYMNFRYTFYYGKQTMGEFTRAFELKGEDRYKVQKIDIENGDNEININKYEYEQDYGSEVECKNERECENKMSVENKKEDSDCVYQELSLNTNV